MSRTRRTPLVAAAIGAMTLAGCATTTPADVEVGADTIVIDVRTPAEYDEGRLDTAVNYDIQGPDFASQVAALDPEGSYVVYCRSGKRAGAAVDYLEDLGFDDVQNIGGLDDAAQATGLDVVR